MYKKVYEVLSQYELVFLFNSNELDYGIGNTEEMEEKMLEQFHIFHQTIPKEEIEVMVFGDSLNDYSMLSMDFGATVAMENADSKLKRVAKYTTKSNVNDGVAYAIEKLLEHM